MNRLYNDTLVKTTIIAVDELSDATSRMQLAGARSGWYYVYMTDGIEYQAYSSRPIQDLQIGTKVTLTLGRTMFKSNYEHFVDGKKVRSKSHCKSIEEYTLVY
jgi:hypothetical protein